MERGSLRYHLGPMRIPPRLPALLAALVVTSACGMIQPAATPAPTPEPTPTPTPSPTPVPDVSVPLAVVTGYTNLKSKITAEEVEATRSALTLIQPCEMAPAAELVGCMGAEAITPHLHANPTALAGPTLLV
jgi:hypothetical protein